MCYNFKNVSTCDNNVLSEFTNNLIIHCNRFLCELINPFHPKGFPIDE